MGNYFDSAYWNPLEPASATLSGAPFISIVTNSTGTNLTLSLTPPTNALYSQSVVLYRLFGREFLNTFSTTTVVSGNFTISGLTERRVYEIIAVPELIGGSADVVVSNCLHVVPTSGSIREKILDFITAEVKTVLTEELSDIISEQIQLGQRNFHGKFRGFKGVVLIDGERTNIEPYTNATRLVTYEVRVHVAWQDRRREEVEDNLGLVAEELRLKLDASQSSTVPNLIIAEVNEIPFSSDVFDLGEHMRGFALQVDFMVQEEFSC